MKPSEHIQTNAGLLAFLVKTMPLFRAHGRRHRNPDYGGRFLYLQAQALGKEVQRLVGRDPHAQISEEIRARVVAICVCVVFEAGLSR